MVELSTIDLLLLRRTFKSMNIDINSYKDDFLRRRIRARMLKLKINSFNEYLRILRRNAEERLKLLDALAINVSSFFRDPPVWNFIKHNIFAPLFRRAKCSGKRVRIWSAGCAHGQEPYTIAILSLETMKLIGFKVPVIIYATDIDEDALASARRGIYTVRDIRNVPSAVLNKYFTPLGDGYYGLKSHVKNLVRFKKHDLIKDNPLLFIDIIFCRNVLIYFQKDAQINILQKFYKSLTSPGYLILGMSESLPRSLNNMFKPLSPKYRVYVKG